MCSTETYTKARKGDFVWHISSSQWYEKKKTLLSPLFNFASEYLIMKFQEDKERLKLTWTHHLPVQAGDVILLDENTSTIKK